MISTKIPAQAQPSHPHSLGRGRYWVFVSGRRWDRGSDARRAEWERHMGAHPPWQRGAEKDAGCTYCAAVKQ